MKIALIEPVGGHGGMNYYDMSLARGIVNSGGVVYWYTCDETNEENEMGINIYKYFKGIYGSRGRVLRATKYMIGLLRAVNNCKKEHIRVAHLHTFQYTLMEYVTVRVLTFFRLKIVVTLHDVESFNNNEANSYLGKILNFVRHIIVHNKFSLLEYERIRCQFDNKFAMASVIPHGNYMAFIRAIDKSEARRKLGLRIDTPKIMFFGQIKKVKGLDLLLRAFKEYRDKGGEAELIIAGKEWKDEIGIYDSIISKLGLEDCVFKYTRYIEDDEVELFYGSADLVVLPYRKIYQSGVLLMAMSYGKAILAPNLEPMKEVINHGENGYLFCAGDVTDLSDQISLVLANLSRLGDVGRNAKEYVEVNCDWNMIGKMTAEVYGRYD